MIRKDYIALIQGQLPANFELIDKSELIEFLNRHKLFATFDSLLNQFEESDRNLISEILTKRHVQSLQLTGVLVEIIQELSEIGIDVIPLKGPVLAIRLYDDISKRHSGDIDLVIKNSDVRNAVDRLKKLGFRLISPKPNLTNRQINYFIKFKKEYCVYNSETGIFVELHIGLYDRGLLKLSKGNLLLDDLESGQIGGITFREMNKNTTFLYLAYHGAKHQYFRLIWLKDIADSLIVWNLDHNSILELAKTIGIERFLAVSLELSHKIFNSQIPVEYSDLLMQQKTTIEKLSKLCLSRIFGPEIPDLRSKLLRLYYIILISKSLQNKYKAVTNIFHRWVIRKFYEGYCHIQ